MKRKVLADLTKYPSIFANTYWGWTGVDRVGGDGLSDELLANRNRFVEEFDIVGLSRSYLPYRLMNDGAYDHREAYRTRDGRIILVSSPYTGPGDAEIHEKAGFVSYPKLYHTKADTWIKVFANMAECRKQVRLADKKRGM